MHDLGKASAPSTNALNAVGPVLNIPGRHRAAEKLACEQLRQVLVLLRLGRVADELADAQVAVRPVRQRHGAGRPTQLLCSDAHSHL